MTTTSIELVIGPSCLSCDACTVVCPTNCIVIQNNQFAIEPWSCVLCMACQEVCPVDCINYKSESDS